MSNEKLSELSKPVAYKFDHGVMGPGDFKYGTPQMHSTAKDENASPPYSQEYVSALLAELEAKDKRIAELSVGKVGNALLERENHHVEVVDKMLERIAELEAKLATPVRLPTKYSMLLRTDFHEDYHSTMAFKSVEVFDAIRAAGFTVEG